MLMVGRGVITVSTIHGINLAIIFLLCQTSAIFFYIMIILIESGPQTNIGSREESEVAGFFVFSQIRMMGYFRLGLVR